MKEREELMEHYGFGPGVMKRTRVCPHCGTATTSDGICCSVCGGRLPRETLYDEYSRRHQSCPHCGAVLAEWTAYCPQCGRKLGAKEDQL